MDLLLQKKLIFISRGLGDGYNVNFSNNDCTISHNKHFISSSTLMMVFLLLISLLNDNKLLNGVILTFQIKERVPLNLMRPIYGIYIYVI